MRSPFIIMRAPRLRIARLSAKREEIYSQLRHRAFRLELVYLLMTNPSL